MELQNVSGPMQTAVDSARRSTLSSDYETFLQMLTVQMTNQDPLNPVDSSDYAVQLATFSSVEQQVLTNELLNELATQLGASGLSELGNWIGKEVRSAAPIKFDGSPIAITTEPTPGATRADLEVLDKNGSAIQILPLDLAQNQISWTGITADGDTLKTGHYSFQIRSFIGEDDIGVKPTGTYSRIQEAQILQGKTVLMLDTGGTILPSDVTAIRD